MRLFGIEIGRKPLSPAATTPGGSGGGWWPVVREPFTGAWQQNIEITLDTVLTNPWVFRCINLISSDVGKLRPRIVEEDENGIWTEKNVAAFSPVLRKPNHFQNRIQFFSQWPESKLIAGNTYVLKERDARGVVVALYILDPRRCRPLVAPDGSVFYELYTDDLAGLKESTVAVPAREIIHDRWNCFFHPLVGLSPLYAGGLSAMQGIKIIDGSTRFFSNGARPGGVLTAPGAISDETATRLKEYWNANFTGENAGKVAVVGDGLKYEAMAQTAHDSQLSEQLKLTAEAVCTVFGVPGYKVGVGAMPSYQNINALDQAYYSDCVQIHLESIELCLDEGLALPGDLGTEFDLDGLFRMDTPALIKSLGEGVRGGLMAPNEGRKKLNLKPVKGGDTPYLQHQDYSLEALAERDEQGPAPSDAAGAAALPPPANDTQDDDETEAEKAARIVERREIALAVFERKLRERLEMAQ